MGVIKVVRKVVKMKTKILAIALLSITLLPGSNIAAQEKIEAKGWAVIVIDEHGEKTSITTTVDESTALLEVALEEGQVAYRTFLK